METLYKSLVLLGCFVWTNFGLSMMESTEVQSLCSIRQESLCLATFDLYIPCTSFQESDFPVFKIQNFPYLLKFNPASFFSPFVSQSLFLLLISLPGSQSVSLFFHTLLRTFVALLIWSCASNCARMFPLTGEYIPRTEQTVICFKFSICLLNN